MMMRNIFSVWKIGLLENGLVCIRIHHNGKIFEASDAVKIESIVDGGMQILRYQKMLNSALSAVFNCLHMQSYGNDGFHQPMINLISMTKTTRLQLDNESLVLGEKYSVICLLL